MYTSNRHMPYFNNSKGIEYQCNFFVVPGNEPALLGTPYCKFLKLLTVNFQTQKQTELQVLKTT